MTYSDLIAAVKGYLVGHAVTDQDVAGFISLAEADMGRNLRLRQSIIRAALPVTDGRVTLPSDFAQLERAILRTYAPTPPPTVTVMVGIVSIAPGSAAKPVPVQVGPDVVLGAATMDHTSRVRVRPFQCVPTSYSIEGNTLAIKPAPDAALIGEVEITYYRRPTALSDANPTSWLLDLSPDLVLYSTLAAAGHWIADPQRSALWRAESLRIAQELDVDTRTSSAGGSPLVMRSRARL